MYGRDFGRFSRQVNKYLLFFRFRDFFLRSSRYFSSILISINFYHVECGDGRQPRILVDQVCIRRSKTRTFSIPGFLTEPCYYFFSHQNEPLPFFFSRPKQLYQSYEYSRPTSHQIWKDLMLLDSPNIHPPLKNNQRKKANFNSK